MKGKICNGKTKEVFKGKILSKYTISYFHCSNCGFLQTEKPYWLNEAYFQPINISDTGYVQRNITLSKKLTLILTLFFDKNRKFLDYAGGHGLFVRLMRDIGFDFYWHDPYARNIFARGFELEIDENSKVEVITTFETFEHFANPIKEIEKMLSISKSIIFTTELLPQSIPNPDNWWYYGLDHGQHISFFSKRTLQYIASKYTLNYGSVGNLHVFTDKKNITDFRLKLLKFIEFGFAKFFKKNIKSKTWEDYLKMSKDK